MKRFIILCLILSFPLASFGMYDFCESPSDYDMCPNAYDIRTEYWKDIPDYHPDDIKYEDMKNQNPTFPLKFRNKKQKNNSNDKNNE